MLSDTIHDQVDAILEDAVRYYIDDDYDQDTFESFIRRLTPLAAMGRMLDLGIWPPDHDSEIDKIEDGTIEMWTFNELWNQLYEKAQKIQPDRPKVHIKQPYLVAYLRGER